jgi:hypothetical protein
MGAVRAEDAAQQHARVGVRLLLLVLPPADAEQAQPGQVAQPDHPLARAVHVGADHVRAREEDVVGGLHVRAPGVDALERRHLEHEVAREHLAHGAPDAVHDDLVAEVGVVDRRLEQDDPLHASACARTCHSNGTSTVGASCGGAWPLP